IAVDTTVSGNLGFELKIHKFLIGYEDEELDQRIEEGINIGNTNYINSLSGVIDTVLSGIILSTHFNMTFNKGKYNLSPLIASFGLPEIADTDIVWTFTDDFILDMSINMQIALDRDNPNDSTFVFELKADDDVKIGEGTDGIKFAKDTVLIGIYGYQNSIYIDLAGFKIANITLPKLKFDLNFSDVIFSLLDRVIAQLLTSMNIEGGDLVFNFDLSGLLGLSSTPATIATADGDNEGNTTVQEAMSAIILGVNADAITPIISMASILAVIKEIDGTLIDETIQEALELMEINLRTSMGRKDGFVFEFNGNLVPVMDEDNVCTYYYKDGEKLPSFDADGKKIIYSNADKENPQYDYKKYNYTNTEGVDSGFYIRFEMGTDRAPVIVGKIPDDKKYPFATKASEFTQYRSDLIEAIMETIGGGALDLSLTLYTHDNVMDLQRLINNVLANLGKRLEIPINLNLDDWQTDVKLLLQWDIDLNSSARSAIKLELQYRGKVLLGVYVYRNNLVLDLEGLGLFSAKLVNTDIVGKVFEMLRGYVSTIEGMDLNQIIGDLLKDLDLPTLPGAGSTEGDVATDDNVSTIGENLEVMDLVKYILRAVSIK
ncbi:MAG: hypothetical protein K2K24_03090, partial [Clostridia bacterium]|nr:hypothetical protein [Clostridia bacterium]